MQPAGGMPVPTGTDAGEPAGGLPVLAGTDAGEPAGGLPRLMPVPAGTDAGDPAPVVHEPGLPVPKPEDPPTELTSSSSSGPRGTATPVVNPVAQDPMSTETLGVPRGREELADDIGDEDKIRAVAVKIIEDVKLVSALSGPPLDDRASFLKVEI